MIPQLVTFITLLVLLIVGTLVAIPAIQNVFEQMGSEAELPAITMAFQRFLNRLVQYWYIPTFIIIGTIVRNSYVYKDTGR
ncbi:MAG: hypothetical protein FWC68_04335 [Oscillospiraceae bacterium]|nr:hypothetical protein [Oscillospiraceae bacterium]